MVRSAAAIAGVVAGLALAGPAAAEAIKVHDENGAPVEVDLATLDGCKIVFNAEAVPFEICRMKRVELAPPGSSRARPGQTTRVGEAAGSPASVVYTKAND